MTEIHHKMGGPKIKIKPAKLTGHIMNQLTLIILIDGINKHNIMTTFG